MDHICLICFSLTPVISCVSSFETEENSEPNEFRQDQEKWMQGVGHAPNKTVEQQRVLQSIPPQEQQIKREAHPYRVYSIDDLG